MVPVALVDLTWGVEDTSEVVRVEARLGAVHKSSYHFHHHLLGSQVHVQKQHWLQGPGLENQPDWQVQQKLGIGQQKLGIRTGDRSKTR